VRAKDFVLLQIYKKKYTILLMLLAESGTNRRQKICKQESFNQIRMLIQNLMALKATYPHFIYEQTVSSSKVFKKSFFFTNRLYCMVL
jgi:hypothetical protein